MFLVVILIYSAQLFIRYTLLESFHENKTFLAKWVYFHTFILCMVKDFILITLYSDYFWNI